MELSLLLALVVDGPVGLRLQLLHPQEVVVPVL